MQNEKIKDTLLEVRKAYRLLYEYQTSILSLMKYIGNKYDLKYDSGWTGFSKPAPNNAQGDLNRSAWDWLNLYFYQFHFVNDIKKIKFSVFLMSDTGAFEYYKEAHDEERKKNPSIARVIQITDTTRRLVSHFNAPENSTSKLIFIVGSTNNNNVWDPNAWWEGDKFYYDFLFEEKVYKNDEGKAMFFKHYNLEDFETKDKADEKLRDFEDECLKNGILLATKEMHDSENEHTANEPQ